ncbi:MAG: DNA (cytosine-5)-methyltransferase 1 [Francisella sp.]|jgi:DNA (cytosine-5)-methyltransferase 1
MINIIDLFAGCGGLSEGFLKSEEYNTLSAIEWEKYPLETLRKRMLLHGYNDVIDRCIRFDIQKTEDLFDGFYDMKYGKHPGLAKILNNTQVDMIVGGPPCQSYSIAGRVGVKDKSIHDYRNFLFESYINVVKRTKPKFILFENVVGLASAEVNGVKIYDLIVKSFNEAGYHIPKICNDCIFDMSYYKIPQARKRVILFGVRKDIKHSGKLISSFYKKLNDSRSSSVCNIGHCLDDLPKLTPLSQTVKKISHSIAGKSNNIFSCHYPRFHNSQDIKIFKLLAKDIENKEFKYVSSKALVNLYNKLKSKNSKFHKYHVLRRDKPSNTIPAHLYKDGLRHIHPDSSQARTITVREAARLQSFPDNYEFVGSMGAKYKMIGNAVPPKFSELLASIIIDLQKEIQK